MFVEDLFSFHYEQEMLNEFERLMDLWTNVGYLHAFALENKIADVYQFVEDRLQDAEEVQDLLERLSGNKQPLGYYFEPLLAAERGKALAMQKGKIRRNHLRYYAIKIHENCFVITGGAIKMSQKMDEHPGTTLELQKLKQAKAYLQSNGVFDECSFYELLDDEEQGERGGHLQCW